MKHLAEFFKNIRWWDMAPHPELVQEYPQPLCLANPGEEYVLYLRYAGTVKVRMNESAASGQYQYYWFNPATGKSYDPQTIQGNSILEFSCPGSYPDVPDYRDWVLYIGRK
jgi:hypothetical protein